DARAASPAGGARRGGQRIVAELPHLFLVELHDIEAAEPRRRIGERLRHARAVGLLAEKQAVQVGVEEAGEAPAQQLRGREVHLVARDEVDVQRVHVRDEGPELRPGPGRHAAPQVRCMKTAAAPYTPAVPVSSPGTMRQASTAGLKARRFTSLRSGRNSLSPASVTPPQMTTTSGLKMLTTFATPAPRNFAVSCTTSSAYSSPSCAASYTIS